MDTYALVEIAQGNSKFATYLNGDFVITDLTLAEFFGVLLRSEGEEIAEYWFKKLGAYSIAVDKDLLREAVKFRYEHRKADISLFDSVGYVFSIKNGFLFVTGDKEFEKFEGVEFRKK